MRTRLAVVGLAVSLCAACATGQMVRGYGLKAGAVIANQTWDYTGIPDLPTDDRWGVAAGAYCEFLDLPVISVLAEFQYVQQGMELTLPVTTASQPEGTGQFITAGPRVDYLSLLALAKLRYSTPAIEPYLLVGPRMDFLVSSSGNGYEAVTERFDESEFGGTVGVGVEFLHLLPFPIIVEARYNGYFTKSFDNAFLSVRNRSFALLLGVHL